MGQVGAIARSISPISSATSKGGAKGDKDSSLRGRCCTIQEIATVVVFFVCIAMVVAAFVLDRPYLSIPPGVAALVQIPMFFWARNVRHLKGFGENNDKFAKGIITHQKTTAAQHAAVDRHNAITTRQEVATGRLNDVADRFEHHGKEMTQSATTITTKTEELTGTITRLQTDLEAHAKRNEELEAKVKSLVGVIDGLNGIYVQEQAQLQTFSTTFSKVQTDGNMQLDQMREVSGQLTAGVAGMQAKQAQLAELAKTATGEARENVQRMVDAVQAKIDSFKASAANFEALFSSAAVSGHLEQVRLFTKMVLDAKALYESEVRNKMKLDETLTQARGQVNDILAIKAQEEAHLKDLRTEVNRLTTRLSELGTIADSLKGSADVIVAHHSPAKGHPLAASTPALTSPHTPHHGGHPAIGPTSPAPGHVRDAVAAFETPQRKGSGPQPHATGVAPPPNAVVSPITA